MADPVNPNQQPPIKQPSEPTSEAPSKSSPPPPYGGLTAKPMTFLGMHFTGPEAEKLWGAIIQQVNSQIQKEQARAIKALRKLRESEQGH